MELLQRLTRRQVDALRAVGLTETAEAGASLNAVALALGVQPPSALDHLTLLEVQGLVVRRRGKSRLTTRGRSTLVEYQRHHRIAEGLFSGLGFSADAVCRAAQEVDLALSHATIERMCDAEGHPAVCPHGEPIPPCSTRRASS